MENRECLPSDILLEAMVYILDLVLDHLYVAHHRPGPAFLGKSRPL